MAQNNLNSSQSATGDGVASTIEEQVDIAALVRKWLRYWYWFLLGIAITLTLAYIYLQFTPSVYQVNATLQIKDDKNSGLSGMQDDLISQITMFANSSNLQNEIIVLKSNTLVGQVVKELGLQAEYLPTGVRRAAKVDLYRKSPLYVMPVQWSDNPQTTTLEISTTDGINYKVADESSNTKIQLGQVAHLASGEFLISKNPEEEDIEPLKSLEVVVKPLNTAVNSLLTQLDITPTDKMSSTISLSLKTRVKNKGRDFLNALLKAYQDLGMTEKNRTASNTIQFVSTRLDSLMVDLSNVETELADFMSKNQMADIDEQGKLLLDQSVQVADELTKSKMEMNVLSEVKRYMNQPVSDNILVPSTTGIQDPTLVALIQQFNNAQLALSSQLQAGMKEAHPTIQSLRHQIGELQKSISENIGNNEVALKTTIRDLESQSRAFAAKVSDVPVLQKQFITINRQHEVKQELYKYLLQKREEAAMTKESSVSNSYIVDPAVAQTLPVAPKKKIIYLAAFLLGLLIPGGLLYIKELLNNKIDSKKDIALLSLVPIYGEIMKNPDENNKIVVEPGIRKPIAEQFRNLRTNLNFVLNNRDEKSIIITSSSSGEGKSFIATNLAMAFALTEQRTILLSFDLRKPKLEEYLGRRNFGPGLSMYLSGDLAIEDIINSIPANGHELYFINSGIVPPNPAELMMRPKMDDLFAYLNKNFDRIIIDSPPIGLISDTQILAKYATSTIWAVRHDYTYKEQIKLIDDYYKNGTLPQIGVVVNDIPSSDGYKYGYSYGYYASGYYNDESERKRSLFKRFFRR